MNNTVLIQELKDRYKSSFVEKSVAISELLLTISTGVSNPIKGAGGSDKACIEIHEYLHKLAGSSGMYGYQDIAQLSRAAMDSSQQNDTQLLVEQLNKLRDLLEQDA